MKTSPKAKFVKEVETHGAAPKARKPFKVQEENRRKFIRLEIAAPMTLKKIKDREAHFWPEGDWHVVNGLILNISAGGVLVELDQAVAEGDLVAMQFTLQGVETLANVLGLVKRSDADEGTFLAGIEFLTRAQLPDLMSRAEIDLLGDNCANFNDCVRQVLGKYVSREKVDSDR
jgi:hypothetical protein